MNGESVRLVMFSSERWGRESISRDGNRGDLPWMMMSETEVAVTQPQFSAVLGGPNGVG